MSLERSLLIIVFAAFGAWAASQAAAASPLQLESMVAAKSHLRLAPTATPAAISTPNALIQGPFTYGYSYQGRQLKAFRIGEGAIAKAVIGGIHGGYEWNTTALATAMLAQLRSSPHLVPPEVTLYLIPLANPDGLAAGVNILDGRFNGHSVDLNRNWDYQWRRYATHAGIPVSAGKAPFSEPENAALRDFILDHHIQQVIFYHSSGAVIFSGAGRNTSKTIEFAQMLSVYTGYRYAPEGMPWEVTTGDAIDWLTANGVDAVEIELSTHSKLDFQQNWPALLAFLSWSLAR